MGEDLHQWNIDIFLILALSILQLVVSCLLAREIVTHLMMFLRPVGWLTAKKQGPGDLGIREKLLKVQTSMRITQSIPCIMDFGKDDKWPICLQINPDTSCALTKLLPLAPNTVLCLVLFTWENNTKHLSSCTVWMAHRVWMCPVLDPGLYSNQLLRPCQGKNPTTI